MRIDVTGRNLEVTDAIRQYAESKVGKLLRYYDHIQQITVRLEQAKHQEFQTEIVVDVEHHEDFVSHAKADDLYASVDLATDKSVRQLTDFKERLKLGKR